ncbi:MAG: lytic transglycosylase domain-containing protein [Candidatus Hydrogenedentes bacterium]|nr:lytic transglycosylase domain-containing protein [Candidatus Hydrogenedentota bacterium]
MAIYQPRDGGTPVLTNRIEKYEGRNDFTRIKINFDPIVRDRRWGVTIGKYTDTDIHKYVDHYAKLYKVDPSLIHAIIQVESRGNPYAVSPKGAAGLMQLMPGTARDLNVSSVFDPADNIGGGTQYISKLISLFNGDFSLALAGYNAGPETVRRYGGIPPYRETQNYVYLVNLYWDYFRKNGNSFLYTKFDPSLTPAALKAAAKKEREERMMTRLVGDTARDRHDVKLASGLVHPADDVWHQGDYLYLASGGRTYRLREDLVVAVDGVALLSGEVVTASEIEAVPDATVPLPKDESVQLAAQI